MMIDIADRVRRHTAAEVLRRIDDDTVTRVRELAAASSEEIASRLRELDREWDTDRAIEVEAAFMGLFGLALGTLADRRLLALPAMVGLAVFLHATTGWYPLLPVFRRLGLRSAREIARERYALKALRGDFHGMQEVVRVGTVTSVPQDRDPRMKRKAHEGQ
jgi:hypothetical protein